MRKPNPKREERIARCRGWVEYHREQLAFHEAKLRMYENRLFILQAGPIQRPLVWWRQVVVFFGRMFGIERVPADEAYGLSEPDENGNRDID